MISLGILQCNGVPRHTIAEVLFRIVFQLLVGGSRFATYSISVKLFSLRERVPVLKQGLSLIWIIAAFRDVYRKVWELIFWKSHHCFPLRSIYNSPWQGWLINV